MRLLSTLAKVLIGKRAICFIHLFIVMYLDCLGPGNPYFALHFYPIPVSGSALPYHEKKIRSLSRTIGIFPTATLLCLHSIVC